MGNSQLVNVIMKSPNHSGKRTHIIDTITPHCVVGQLSAAGIGSCFASSSVQASCNYGIGTEGDVVLVVDECNRSWCSSSNDNDQRAVTIECACEMTDPYEMNETVYQKLVELIADICKRNGIRRLLWLGSKEKTLAYTPKSGEAVLTAHRWFKNKACPGEWLYSRYGELAELVNEKLVLKPYKIKVLVDDLNYRNIPGFDSEVLGQLKKGKKYMIVKEMVASGVTWGYLKSGKGWISLSEKYVKKL